MNPLIRFHLAAIAWHLSWLAFWLSRQPPEPDTTARTADRWLRSASHGAPR